MIPAVSPDLAMLLKPLGQVYIPKDKETCGHWAHKVWTLVAVNGQPSVPLMICIVCDAKEETSDSGSAPAIP